MFQRGTSGLFARTDPKCGPTLDYLGAEDVSQEKIPPLSIMSVKYDQAIETSIIVM